MLDYATLASDVLELINETGREVTLVRISGTPADPARPWAGGNAPDTVLGTPRATFVPYKGFEFGTDIVDDELLKSVDEVCLIAGASGDFDKADKILDEGVGYKIQWARRLRPAGVTLLYAFGINR